MPTGPLSGPEGLAGISTLQFSRSARNNAIEIGGRAGGLPLRLAPALVSGKAFPCSGRSHWVAGLATVVSAQSGLSQWRAQAPCDLGGWAAAWFSQRMLLASSRQVIFRAAGMRGPTRRENSHSASAFSPSQKACAQQGPFWSAVVALAILSVCPQ